MSNEQKPDAGACPCPTDTSKKRGWLSRVFCSCGSAAGGFLAGHLGCVAAPAVIATTGGTAAALGGGLAVAFGAAATAGGLYLWKKLRWKTSGTWEKRLVIAGAVSGLILSSAFNLFGGGTHHENHAPVQKTENIQPQKVAQDTTKKLCPRGCCGK